MTSELLDWTDHGPRSARFGDVYFSQGDGLAESRAVFLAGCGLPEAWAGRASFTVAELGFGTGLNILALLDLWSRTRASGARLRIFSVEAFPIGRDDARRALTAWPALSGLAEPLLAAWPDGARGWRRIDFPALSATLDLAIGEAGTMLADWDGAADAWFLDGFAPALNPDMWRPDLLALVAQRSAPGARAATFTVAGAVRRGLAVAGFTVEKRPGFGRKRERLEARLAGETAPERPSPSVAVVGAGIAGAALVRALRALGVEPVVYEANGAGAGASGNPSALVTPRLDAGLGPVAALHAQAFARAIALYRREVPQAVIAEGALQLERDARDRARFARLAGWEGFPPGGLTVLAPEEVAAALGQPAGPVGLMIRDASTVEPAPILQHWLDGAAMVRGAVSDLSPAGRGWALRDAGGAILGEAEIVCLAAGPAVATLVDAPLRAVRGQVSWAVMPFEGVAAAWGGYAAPMRDGLLFGATHDRDDRDCDIREEDHRRNLAALAQGRPRSAARIDPAGLSGRASLRAATPDHLPLAGAVPGRPGLFVLGGLGGRGFTLAPLLAEQVAAQVMGAPGPLPHPLSSLVDPARFPGAGVRGRSGESSGR